MILARNGDADSEPGLLIRALWSESLTDGNMVGSAPPADYENNQVKSTQGASAANLVQLHPVMDACWHREQGAIEHSS